MRKLLLSIAFVVASPTLASAFEGHAVFRCLERVAAQSMAGGKAFDANRVSRRFVASCDREMSVYSKRVGLNVALDEIADAMHMIEAESKGWTP